MGFFAMILSMIVGLFFIIFGIYRIKKSVVIKMLIPLGVGLVIFSIWLGFPK